MRLGGSTEVTALDPKPFVAALPALLVRWRALTVTDGGVVHPVTRRTHEGLRLVEGVHPHPGARYRLKVREETAPEPTAHDLAVAERLRSTDPQAVAEWERGRLSAARAARQTTVTWHTVDIGLGIDDEQRTTFSMHHDVTDIRGRIDLNTPLLPGPIDMAFDVPDWAGKTAFLRGMVEVLVRLDPSGPLPHLVAGLSHPHGRAHAEVAVRAAAGARWRGRWVRSYAGRSSASSTTSWPGCPTTSRSWRPGTRRRRIRAASPSGCWRT
jgi:hypothetical protein